jgi:hypothetical protein
MQTQYKVILKSNPNIQYIGYSISLYRIPNQITPIIPANYSILYHCHARINDKPGFWFSYRYFRVDLFEFEKLE